MTHAESVDEQDPSAFAFGRLGAAGFVARNLLPRFSSWAAVRARELAHSMMAEGRSGLVIGDRYPSGRVGWRLRPTWEQMHVALDGVRVCSFRSYGLLGGGFTNLRRNRPVFFDRRPGTYEIEVPTDITEPPLRVSVELRERQVLVVEVHPAVGRRAAKIDVLAETQQVIASRTCS